MTTPLKYKKIPTRSESDVDLLHGMSAANRRARIYDNHQWASHGEGSQPRGRHKSAEPAEEESEESEDEIFRSADDSGGHNRFYKPRVNRKTSHVGSYHSKRHYHRHKRLPSTHSVGSLGSEPSLSGGSQDSEQPPPLPTCTNLKGPAPVLSVYVSPPGTNQKSPVLEASLKRLHEIHDGIHRLRELNANKHHSKKDSRRQNLQRHSSSCPSLAEPKLCVVEAETQVEDQGYHKSMLQLANEVSNVPDHGVNKLDVRRTSSDFTDRTMANQHLEPQVQICINDVTLDSSSTDFASSNCTDLDLLIEKEKKAQKRRSSWCPEEEKKKEEKHEKKQMLAISGRSQSLSSLDGQDDSEEDEDDDDASSTSSYHDQSKDTSATYSSQAPSRTASVLSNVLNTSPVMYGYSSVADYVNSSIYSAASGTNNDPTYKYMSPSRVTTGASGSHIVVPSQRSSSDIHLELQASTHSRVVIGESMSPLGSSNGGATIPLDVPPSGMSFPMQAGSDVPLFKSVSSPAITTASSVVTRYVPGRKSDTDTPSEHGIEDCRHVPHVEALPPEKSSTQSPGHDPHHEAHSTEEEDQPRRMKPRRTSVFSKFGSYRRKNTKDNKVVKNPHHFVSVSFSNSTACDVCSKSMANKPALQCENCMVNVHENTCKDQIAHCSRYGGAKSNHNDPSLKEKKASSLPEGHGAGTSLKASQSMKEKRATSVPSRTSIQVSHSAAVLPRRTTSPSSNGPSSGYFQWRRVATKLGIDRVISEERGEKPEKPPAPKEDESPPTTNLIQVPDNTNITETMSVSMESLEEGTPLPETTEYENDPDLMLRPNEPEAWSVTVDKKTLKKMSAKDIKKQDHIWELVQTEKSHYRTLKIMQKIFSHGMQQELNMSRDMVDRIFPKLDDLLDIHATFLQRLTERQHLRPDLSIEDIGDILVLQFEGEMGHRMKVAYGEFCSRHNEAVQLYKDILKADRKFQTFIKKCSRNNLCKRLGIPECILLVTQRMTKYPLLIEPIIKTTKENKADRELLVHAHQLAKEILSYVDAQIDAHEKYQRLIEIFNKLDARSSAMYKGKKFKKSDLLSNNRKLFHEGVIKWMSARGKPTEVIAVILSDVLFFLSENNQKYSFFTQDNKSAVISLNKLLVREKGDTRDSKGIYLICQSKTEPEMYELVCRSAEERKTRIALMRQAIAKCPDEEEGTPSESEEERKIQEARSARVRQLVDKLHQHDQYVRQNCDEKMKVIIEILQLFSKEGDINISINCAYKDEDGQELMEPGQLLQAAQHEATRLTTLLQGTASAVVHCSQDISKEEGTSSLQLALPKRAETFSGFDGKEKAEAIKNRYPSSLRDEDSRSSSLQNLHQPDTESFLTVEAAGGRPVIRRGSLIETKVQPPTKEKMNRRMSTSFLQHLLTRQHVERGDDTPDTPSPAEVAIFTSPSPPPPPPIIMATATHEQTQSLAQLVHYLHALVCTVTQQSTQVESLRACLADASSSASRLYTENERLSHDKKHGGFHHDKQLEELRNLQETIQVEKVKLDKTRDRDLEEIKTQKEEINSLRTTLEKEKDEIRSQREELQREKEALQWQIDFFEEKKKLESLRSQIGQEERQSPTFLSRRSRDRSESPGPQYVPSPAGVPQSLIDNISHKRSASDDLQIMRLEGGVSEGSPLEGHPPPGRHPPQRTQSSASTMSVGGTPPMKRESIPLHLISKTNEQKLGHVAQQSFPFKLASSPTSGMPSSSGGKSGISQMLPGKLAKKTGSPGPMPPSVSVSVSTSVVMSSSTYSLRTATFNTASGGQASSPAALYQSPGGASPQLQGARSQPSISPAGLSSRNHPAPPTNILPMKLASTEKSQKGSKQRPRSASSVLSPTSPPSGASGTYSQDSSPSSASPVHSQQSSKRKEQEIIYF